MYRMYSNQFQILVYRQCTNVIETFSFGGGEHRLLNSINLLPPLNTRATCETTINVIINRLIIAARSWITRDLYEWVSNDAFPKTALQRRHNERDSVSNHGRHGCLLICLLRRRSKKNQSAASLSFVRGIHRWPVNSPHKGPATRKLFPLDDVIIVKRLK